MESTVTSKSREKSEIPQRIALVGIVSGILLFVWFFYPDTKERDVVKLSDVAKAMLATHVHAVVEKELSLRQTDTTDVVVPMRVARIAEQSTPPPYGADALGAPGAWNGQTEDGVSTVSATDDGKDQFGNPCIRDVRSIDSAILRNMIPPSPVKDKCSYRYVYLSRTTTPPADVLLYGTDATFGIEEISGYMKSGLWSIADFEGLAQFHLAPRGALTLYLMLRSVGSPVATYLQNRKDYGIERGYIDDFLKSGECPDKSETIENYCQ